MFVACMALLTACQANSGESPSYKVRNYIINKSVGWCNGETNPMENIEWLREKAESAPDPKYGSMRIAEVKGHRQVWNGESGDWEDTDGDDVVAYHIITSSTEQYGNCWNVGETYDCEGILIGSGDGYGFRYFSLTIDNENARNRGDNYQYAVDPDDVHIIFEPAK